MGTGWGSGMTALGSSSDSGDKNTCKAAPSCICELFTRELSTNRDAWCYNFSESRSMTSKTCKGMIDFYTSETTRYKRVTVLRLEQRQLVQKWVNSSTDDATRISWSRALKNDLGRFIKRDFKSRDSCTHVVSGRSQKSGRILIVISTKWCTKCRSIFPDGTVDNLVICVTVVVQQKTFARSLQIGARLGNDFKRAMLPVEAL
jgi:predicted helicase